MVKIPNIFCDKFLHKDSKNKIPNLVRSKKKKKWFAQKLGEKISKHKALCRKFS